MNAPEARERVEIIIGHVDGLRAIPELLVTGDPDEPITKGDLGSLLMVNLELLKLNLNRLLCEL